MFGLRLTVVLLTICFTLLAAAAVHADGYGDRRTRAGARLFRSLLAAEIGIEDKAGKDGALHVVVLGGEARLVEELAGLIAPAGDGERSKVRGLPLRVELMQAFDPGQSSSADAALPVAVFLADPPGDAELQRLIAWSIQQRVLLYSPFEGHVEAGVMAGISIEAKVLPYLNATTIEAAGLELKPLFLKVAKVHR